MQSETCTTFSLRCGNVPGFVWWPTSSAAPHQAGTVYRALIWRKRCVWLIRRVTWSAASLLGVMVCIAGMYASSEVPVHDQDSMNVAKSECTIIYRTSAHCDHCALTV